MTWIIFFFGSGYAFYAGVIFVLVAMVFFSFYRRNWSTRIATLLGLFGLILIAASATPLPYWFYTSAGVASLLWLLAERFDNRRLQNWRKPLRCLVCVFCSLGLFMEIPYTFMPVLSPAGRPKLYILADSVTAGMGETAMVTWPNILARSQSIEVDDFSQAGAKVSTMLRKAKGLTWSDGILLLEIGGNDLLGSTSADDYERDLDDLLGILAGPGREVIMFELPLPPFRNEYGRVQRALSQKHGVKLIPKRIFVGVLTTDGATVDSVHLSRTGHELMAKTVWNVIQSAYRR